MNKSKLEATMETVKMIQDSTRDNPLIYEQRGITNTLLIDIATSLSIIADWCNKDIDEILASAYLVSQMKEKPEEEKKE